MASKKIKKRTIILGLTGLLLLVLIGALISIKISMKGRFPPETYVAGIDVSYQSLETTQELFDEQTQKFLKSTLKLTLGDESRQVTPEELGIQIKSQETLQILEEAKRQNLTLLDWIFPDRDEKTEVSLLVSINYEQLFQEMEELFALSASAPKSAQFFFNNGVLEIQEGENGHAINTEKLIDDLKTTAQNLNSQDLKIISEEQAPILTKADLETQKQEIEDILNHEFVLIDPIYSDNWELKLRNYLDWVELVPVQKVMITDFGHEFELEGKLIEAFKGIDTKESISVKIKQTALNAFVDEEISKWLDKEPDQVKIYYDDEKNVIIEGGGNDGMKIQREHLKKAIELAVAHKIKDVPIPVLTLPAKFDIARELQELGINERLSVGHTSYYGSPANRVHNIKTGAEKFNGLLVAPGEIFSFNQNLGPVDASTGYKKELVIKHDGTKPEYGGGLCQVSTTTYRAALFGGFPITERNEHSYAVSYYSQILGHGLDATIYLGGADLQFENDTGHYILIQMYTKDDYELYVVIYGTPDGRSVELEGPYLSNYHNPGPTEYIETTEIPPGTTKQVEKAHTGFNALWYRYVTLPEGEIISETITTHYKAIPSRILVGIEGAEE